MRHNIEDALARMLADFKSPLSAVDFVKQTISNLNLIALALDALDKSMGTLSSQESKSKIELCSASLSNILNSEGD